MSNIIEIEQTPLVDLEEVQVTEEGVSREPTIRRASPEFAYEHGGDVLKRFLDIAKKAGHVHSNSLVMSQPSDFKKGALSTPQYWHFDFTPGMAPKTNEDFKNAVYGNTGLIMCAFDTKEHPKDVGTIFLREGKIELNLEERDGTKEYVPRQNLNPNINSGRVYWWDPIVRKQIIEKNLKKQPITPNVIYEFGSQNIHRVPVMKSNHGQRVLMRINTPVDPTAKSEPENTLIHQSDLLYPRYVFYETTPDTWVRERY